jgi:uncharacterized protein (DUF1778 family)
MTQTSTSASKARRKVKAPGKLRQRGASAKAVPSAVRSARLEARIDPELRSLVQRAAELEGRSLTDFVTRALQETASRVVSQSQILQLALADQQLFADALLSLPDPAPALKRAFARHEVLVRRD